MRKFLLLIAFLSFISTLSFSQIFIKSNPIDEEMNLLSRSNNIRSSEQINQIIPDWIYDTQAPILSSLKSADINNDGVKEIIVSTFDTTDGNPYGAGLIYVLDTNGNNLPGWPKRIVGVPIPATVSLGDVNNDGYKEIVVGSWNQLFVFDYQGNNLTGFPKSFGTSVAATLFDIDKDGYLELIYPSSNKNLYIFKYDGSFLTGWPKLLPQMPGSPAVADIDNDDEYEIVAGTFQGPVGPDPFPFYAFENDGSIISGFPVLLSGVIKSTPAIGDLDGDGSKEIVIISYDDTNDDSLYVIDAAGNFKTGFPLGVHYARLSSPALGDLDGNGTLEIIVGGLTNTEILYGFHYDGTVVQNFPVLLNHPGSSFNINTSPVICDIDGDTTTVEIVVKTNDYIFALHNDTTTVTGFPYFIDDENQSGTFGPSPLIDDFDDDGDVEYVLASIAGKIHYFDVQFLHNKNFDFWNSYKHDEQNTSSVLPIPIFTDVNENNYFTPSNYELMQNYPNPFNPITKIKYSISKISTVQIKVYDVLGNEVTTLINEDKLPGIYEVEINTASHSGNVRNLPSGVYFYTLSTGNFFSTKKMVLLK